MLDDLEVATRAEAQLPMSRYHRGRNWRERFKLVVGVIHTNYKHYAETCAPRTSRSVGLHESFARVSCFGISDSDFGKSDRFLHVYIKEISRICQNEIMFWQIRRGE